MNTKQKTAVYLLGALCMFLAGCGPGQLFGPTLTPTPTMTLTPTLTPTPTLTSTPTKVPTKTPTITPTPEPVLSREGSGEKFKIVSIGPVSSSTPFLVISFRRGTPTVKLTLDLQGVDFIEFVKKKGPPANNIFLTDCNDKKGRLLFMSLPSLEVDLYFDTLSLKECTSITVHFYDYPPVEVPVP